MKNFGSFSAGSNIFSTGTVPYLPIITDRSPLLPATERRGDGYFSGWKIIRRLPQALKWAALRLRTIIIISSDGLGSEVKKDGVGGRGKRQRRRSRRIHGRIYEPPSNCSDVVVNIFTGSLTSRRDDDVLLPPLFHPSLLFHPFQSPTTSHSSALPSVIRAPDS